jgi:hypothetical protein
MELLKGIIFKILNCNTQCLKILNNIYGGKESGCTWFLHLKDTLLNLGYQQSTFEEYVFYENITIFFIYTDNGIIMEPIKETVNDKLKELQSTFEIEIHGNLQEYLGIRIQNLNNGSIHMVKPHLCEAIFTDIRLSVKDKVNDCTKTNDSPLIWTQK